MTENARTTMPLSPPLESTVVPLQGLWLAAARTLWWLLAAGAGFVLLASLPGYANKFTGQLSHISGDVSPPGAAIFAAASGAASLISALISIGLAALLYRRKFREPIAAFLSIFLILYGTVMSGPLERSIAYWLAPNSSVGVILQAVLLSTPTVALLMLLPNGRFVPGWTRWVVLLSIPWNLGLVWIAPFDAEAISRNPLLSAVVSGLFFVFILIGIYAQLYRYRNTSSESERRQTRWAIFGFSLWVIYILLSTFPYLYLTGLPPGSPAPWWAAASELGWWLSLNILPVCLTIAITRHQLWDIDLVVNRTLVYGILTSLVLALYALVVGGMGVLFRTRDNFLLPLLATGLAAYLFHPMQQRLQRSINRLMFGERDDPAAVLTSLGEQLEKTGSAEATLSRIVETIAVTLKLIYAAVQLEGEPAPAASFGIPVNTAIRFPLVYQGETVGTLLAAGRHPGEPLTSRDIKLLEGIARQTGAVAHNALLTADLQRSRSRLVTAREEERRRIRRDLHDGLGPQLASQGLTLDAIEKLLERDPERVRELIQRLKVQSQEAIQDIRSLIYELRPPALDDLGLVPALRQETARYENTGMRVEIAGPDPFPPVPAAVELAAYRIVQEAVNNAFKHASASLCRVQFEFKEEGLAIEITDNGRGLAPDWHSGVGFQAMRERAAELDGHLSVRGGSGAGVVVRAALPLPEAE